MTLFHRLIMADWSAASAPGPKRPTKDRCWVGCLDAGQSLPELVYCRTRAVAVEQIAAWKAEASGATGGQGKTLIGFDFPFGYPADSGMSGGRALATQMGQRLLDEPDDRNNRFDLAAALNQQLLPGQPGPFWGHPPGRVYEGRAPTRPKPWPEAIPEYRLVDAALRGSGIQTVWKLAYTASVGSQVMTGMMAVHRLLQRPVFQDARIWPFETAWGDTLSAVTIAEIWPNLFYDRLNLEPAAATYPIRDAQQVAATLLALQRADQQGRIEALLAAPTGFTVEQLAAISGQEGWIIGA
jgi:hypothetical protein